MNRKVLVSIISLTIFMGTLTGCKAYDVPELIEISPSQTAILLPLEGETSEQSKLGSEEFLANNLVSSKRIQIPHKWIQEGRMESTGKYIPTHKLIIIERKPITREWTDSDDSGTSTKKQGVRAESKESIAFSSNINCTAQIDEPNAVKFLYRYNGSTLEDIMDTEIRSRVNTKFVEQCAKYSLAELLINKATIMDGIRTDVIPYFAERGITITALGISGDLTYTNPEIQKSIDEKFKAEKYLETQKSENEITVSKAKADAEAIQIQSSTIDKQIQLKNIEVQSEAIKKWDGKLPTTQGGNSGFMINLPTNSASK